jgi:hypothetical protein
MFFQLYLFSPGIPFSKKKKLTSKVAMGYQDLCRDLLKTTLESNLGLD